MPLSRRRKALGRTIPSGLHGVNEAAIDRPIRKPEDINLRPITWRQFQLAQRICCFRGFCQRRNEQ